jgi:GntR family transcriptional regulator of vanillate catabolism
MSSQTIKALMSLRELILSGDITPGERLLEVALVDRLEVSRTPIRAALVKLAEEGLLEQMPNGGYAVRKFTEHDIRDAIEARGMLEGMAARLAAERGVSALSLSKLKDCVEGIDDLLETTNLTSSDISRYFDLNELFHHQLVALSESFVVERMLERIVTLPFASPNAFVMAQSEIGQSWKVFFIAQEHHRGIIEAIENREGMRAESLAREHARLALRTLKTVLKNKSALDQVPGSKFIYNSAA